MANPICCGKRSTSYHKTYGAGRSQSWEEGFRCKKCGRIRIPAGGANLEPNAYMAGLDAVREAGIKLDESISKI